MGRVCQLCLVFTGYLGKNRHTHYIVMTSHYLLVTKYLSANTEFTNLTTKFKRRKGEYSIQRPSETKLNDNPYPGSLFSSLVQIDWLILSNQREEVDNEDIRNQDVRMRQHLHNKATQSLQHYQHSSDRLWQKLSSDTTPLITEKHPNKQNMRMEIFQRKHHLFV